MNHQERVENIESIEEFKGYLEALKKEFGEGSRCN